MITVSSKLDRTYTIQLNESEAAKLLEEAYVDALTNSRPTLRILLEHLCDERETQLLAERVGG